MRFNDWNNRDREFIIDVLNRVNMLIDREQEAIRLRTKYRAMRAASSAFSSCGNQPCGMQDYLGERADYACRDFCAELAAAQMVRGKNSRYMRTLLSVGAS